MRFAFAVLLAVGVAGLGIWILSAIGRNRDLVREAPVEDVEALDVYFVCGECGTEFRVEKLGELQVPRHCGETMRVEQRPAPLR
ncbi:MAG TPA: hypothetical protein VF097_12405 [Actinomycetota bacterium]